MAVQKDLGSHLPEPRRLPPGSRLHPLLVEFDRALAIYEAALPPEHPTIRNLREFLASLDEVGEG